MPMKSILNIYFEYYARNIACSCIKLPQVLFSYFLASQCIFVNSVHSCLLEIIRVLQLFYLQYYNRDAIRVAALLVVDSM